MHTLARYLSLLLYRNKKAEIYNVQKHYPQHEATFTRKCNVRRA